MRQSPPTGTEWFCHTLYRVKKRKFHSNACGVMPLVCVHGKNLIICGSCVTVQMHVLVVQLYLFVCLSLAVLGLCCGVQAVVAVSGGCSRVAVHRLLGAVVSLWLWSMGSRVCSLH